MNEEVFWGKYRYNSLKVIVEMDGKGSDTIRFVNLMVEKQRSSNLISSVMLIWWMWIHM